MKDEILKILNESTFDITPYEGGEGLRVIDAEDFGSLADEIINALNKDFKTSSLLLIKYLCENHHPHVTAIITPTGCELVEGLEAHPKIYEFIKD